jgi:hypothetical protein
MFLLPAISTDYRSSSFLIPPHPTTQLGADLISSSLAADFKSFIIKLALAAHKCTTSGDSFLSRKPKFIMTPKTSPAWILSEQKGIDSLQLVQENPIPEVGEYDVLLKIHAASLNYRDIVVAKVHVSPLNRPYEPRSWQYPTNS